ncbi:MAG: hypothetical protein EA424_23460 [Planctomycetaceae bacterium]|nr:MAG: hypothetical protein EA424_23460 [Planctomycetaceae bacterium]
MKNLSRHHLPDVDTPTESQVGMRGRALELLAIHDAKLKDVAHYLHDEIGQLLVSSCMHLHLSIEAQPVSPHLTTCLSIVQQAIERVRELKSHLHPSMIEHLPFPEALRCSLDDRARRDGVAIELLTPSCWFALPSTVEITCYRVVMEAVDHAISHKATTRVRVELRQDAETVELTIRDVVSTLTSISSPPYRDRTCSAGWNESCQRIEWLGGKWQIESISGQGETVRIRLPIEPAAANFDDVDVL